MRPLMGRQAVIDPLRFVREGGQLAGAFDIARLSRLRDSLYCDQERVSYALIGAVDSKARPVLRIQISGTIVVQCQRCLGPLSIPLELSSALIVAEKGREPDFEPLDVLDWIPAEQGIDPATLVEEEILLALPMSPRHPEGECSAPQHEMSAEFSARAKNADFEP
jgi:DUF177 domain-containing protein